MGVNRSRLRQTVSSFTRTGGKSFHKFHNKVNRIRLIPFDHRMNRFDVLRGEAKDEELNEVFTMIDVASQEVFTGGAYRTCLPGDYTCRFREMAWAAYHAWKEEGKNGNKPATPRDCHYVNAVDLDEPEKGVQQMKITPQLWNGTNKEGQHTFYGIKDLLYGYYPDQEEDGTEKKKGLLGGSGSFLKQLDGFGEDLFHMDVHVTFMPTQMNSNAFMVDTAAEGGPTDVLDKDESEKVPARFYKEAKDLYLVSKYYPGWSSDEDYQDDCDLEDFMVFATTGKDPKSGSTPSKEIQDEDGDGTQSEGETENQETSEGQEAGEDVQTESGEGEGPQPAEDYSDPVKPKKKTRRRRKIKKSDTVEYTDKTDGMVYRGKAEAINGDVLSLFARPEEQLNEGATADVQEQWDGYEGDGNPIFDVPLSDCVLVHEDES